MKYVNGNDINEFFKLIGINYKSNIVEKEEEYVTTYSKNYHNNKAYFCCKCFQLWSSKRKGRYLEHTTNCIGKYFIPVVTNKKLYTFDKHDCAMNLPFTMYIDFETTAPSSDYMIPISYSIHTTVNSKYIGKDENVADYDHLTVKSIWDPQEVLQATIFKDT